MSDHSHDFVEKYQGLVGFGLDRPTDEATVMVYLQKFSDDSCLKAMVPRMSDEELSQVFELISALLYKHLEEPEYHSLFLKEKHEE